MKELNEQQVARGSWQVRRRTNSE